MTDTGVCLNVLSIRPGVCQLLSISGGGALIPSKHSFDVQVYDP